MQPDKQVVAVVDGVPAVSSIRFTPADWETPRRVRIDAVDDAVDEVDVHAASLGFALQSRDPRSDGLTVSPLSVTVADDDTAGVMVTPRSGLETSEAGGRALFLVRLASQPTANVTIGVASDDRAEGTPSATELLFTPETWNVPRLVAVTGVDDAVVDGDASYTVVLAAAASGDGRYDRIDPADLFLVNRDDGETLVVTSMVATASGFHVRFNRALEPSVLNLFDSAAAALGPADALLVGEQAGKVSGSLVIAPERDAVTFIATGGALVPDRYTLTLRSAAGAFRGKDRAADTLDGDRDGVAGGDFVRAFDAGSFALRPNLPGVDQSFDVGVGGVVALKPVEIRLPDFARGPGQDVEVPARGAGLPVTLDDGEGVTRIELTLAFDPALLEIAGVLPGADLPTSAAISVDASKHGVLAITVTLSAPLESGPVEILSLAASVPGGAPYGVAQVIDLEAVFNDGGMLAIADDALHLVALLGDATANRGYSALDAQRILRVAVGADSGFAAYPLVDPVVVGDVTGASGISALDAALVLQQAVGRDRAEIPELPGVGAAAFVPRAPGGGGDGGGASMAERAGVERPATVAGASVVWPPGLRHDEPKAVGEDLSVRAPLSPSKSLAPRGTTTTDCHGVRSHQSVELAEPSAPRGKLDRESVEGRSRFRARRDRRNVCHERVDATETPVGALARTRLPAPILAPRLPS